MWVCEYSDLVCWWYPGDKHGSDITLISARGIQHTISLSYTPFLGIFVSFCLKQNTNILWLAFGYVTLIDLQDLCVKSEIFLKNERVRNNI
jgi:hypothetical protein